MAASHNTEAQWSPLVSLLRCPRCGQSVSLEGEGVVCGGAHRFPIAGGVPVMVEEAALRSDPQYRRQRDYFDAEFARLTSYRLEPWRQSYLQRLRACGALGRPGSYVLDVGVGGSGYTVIEAARTGAYAVGCDLSLVALSAARKFAEAEGVGTRTLWVGCSAERLPLASEAFASVLAIAVLEHVPDDGSALREAARVLRPGGYLWVTVPHGIPNTSPVFRLPNRLHDRRLGHLRRYEADALIDAGKAVGLTAVDVHFTGHPVKVLQVTAARLPVPARDRLWWWCEARDLRRRHVRRGSMQLSVLFQRTP